VAVGGVSREQGVERAWQLVECQVRIKHMASVDQPRQQRKDIHMMKHSLLTVRMVSLAYSTYKQENP